MSEMSEAAYQESLREEERPLAIDSGRARVKFGDLLVYDAETARCIPDAKKERDPNLDYCEGWTDYLGMSISVVTAYDCGAKLFRVFMLDNLDEFATLAAEKVCVGFNIASFDNNLLAAHGVAIPRSWDMMVEFRAALGEPRHYVPGVTRGGRKVSDYARVNLGESGVGKTGEGKFAPQLWQEGKRGTVIDYALRDVYCELGLLKRCPNLIDPRTMKPFTVRPPHA